jgi:hypothetical protein
VDTYSGQTIINGGTLQLAAGASVAGNVQVNSGASLTGSGTVLGTLTAAPSANVVPGLAPSGLTAANVSLAASSNFLVSATGNQSFSQLSSGGNVALRGNLQVSLGFTPAIGTQFIIVNNTGSNTPTGTFAGLPTSGSLFTAGAVTLEILYNGGPGNNSVVLQVMSIAGFNGQPPALLSPSGAVSSLTPTFSWSLALSADHYEISINDLTTGQSISNQHVTGTSFVPTTPLAQGHNYTWYVRPISSTGTAGKWSSGFNFSISPMAGPSLIGPSGLAAGSQTPTFSWNPVLGATSYRLWVNNLTTGQSGFPIVTVPGTSTNLAQLPDYGDTYAWWVQGIDAHGNYGPWSSSLTFSLAPLGTPTLIGPSGAANLPVTFTWNAVSGADHYDLWVNDTTTGQAHVIRQNQVTGTSFTTSALTPSHSYTWYVAANTAANQEGFWSAPLTFTVVASPVPIGPSGNAVSAAGEPTFSWQSVSGAASYELWVTDNTTGQVALDTSGISGTTFTPSTPLRLDDNITWWVRVTGAASWSAGTNFTLAPFAAPTSTSPVGGITTRFATFAWSGLAGADHYDLWVNNLTTGQNQVIREQNVLGASFTTGPLISGDTYQWWVRAMTSENQAGYWSAGASFTIQPFTAATLLGPSGQQTNPLPTFTWTATPGADRYELWLSNTNTGQVVLDRLNISGTSFIPTTPLDAGAAYEWWVRAFTSANGGGMWSAPLSFTLTALPAPVLYQPAGTSSSLTPAFSWSPLAGADHYDLWVNNLTTGQSQALRNQNVAGASFTPATPLVAGDQYEWWVRGVTSAGADGYWSTPVEFTAGTSPAQITVSVRPSLSPNLGSSSFTNSYISNAIYALQNGIPVIGAAAGDPAAYYNAATVTSNDMTTTGSPGFWLGQSVSSPSPFAGEFGNLLALGVVVTGNLNHTGPQVELDDLTFQAASTDPSGFYSGTISASLVSSYSNHAVGVVFNSDGTVNHLVTSGAASQLVDEIVYVGIGLSNDATTYPSLAAALAFNQSLGNFTITSTYTYNNGRGTVVSGSATVNVRANS